MRAPEITYRFALSDFGSLTLETVMRNGDTTANAASIFTPLLSAIAKDRALVLTNIASEAVPGVLVGVSGISFTATTNAGLNFSVARGSGPVTADTPFSLNWSGEVMITGQGGSEDLLDIRCFFTGAHADNRLICSCNGYIIPRGNIGNF